MVSRPCVSGGLASTPERPAHRASPVSRDRVEQHLPGPGCQLESMGSVAPGLSPGPPPLWGHRAVSFSPVASGSHGGWVSSSFAALVPGSLGAENSESVPNVSAPFPRRLALHQAGRHPLGLSRGPTFVERHRVRHGECEEGRGTAITSRSPWVVRCESGGFLPCLRKLWAVPSLRRVRAAGFPASGRTPRLLCPPLPGPLLRTLESSKRDWSVTPGNPAQR